MQIDRDIPHAMPISWFRLVPQRGAGFQRPASCSLAACKLRQIIGCNGLAVIHAQPLKHTDDEIGMTAAELGKIAWHQPDSITHASEFDAKLTKDTSKRFTCWMCRTPFIFVARTVLKPIDRSLTPLAAIRARASAPF
jgi:hypothetical protein